MHFAGVVLSVMVLLRYGQDANLQFIRPPCVGAGTDVFERSCIIPDVIDYAPLEVLEVRYANNYSVDNGNELKPEDVKDAPESVHWNGQSGNLYTLSECDPDSPNRLNFSRAEINHWLVVNIPDGDIAKGDILADYIGSQPLNGSGLHRYVFLVFRQADRLNMSDPALQALQASIRISPTNRIKFDVRQFARTYNLGNPVAGNFYRAQYSDFLVNVTH